MQQIKAHLYKGLATIFQTTRKIMETYLAVAIAYLPGIATIASSWRPILNQPHFPFWPFRPHFNFISSSLSVASYLSGIATLFSASEYTQSWPASSQDGQGEGGFPAQRVLRLRQRLHLSPCCQSLSSPSMKSSHIRYHRPSCPRTSFRPSM